MRIVVVDGYTLNPGDLSWEALEELGEVQVYDDTTGNELAERIMAADAVLTNKVIIPDQLIDQLTQLRYVGVTATGVNIIDLNKAREKDIVVTNAPGYGTASVAQHVFALILEFTNRVGTYAPQVHQGRWREVGRWSYWDEPLTELAGKRLGIIGMGAIGRQVAQIAEAFGMSVVYYNPTPKPVKYQLVKLEEIFQGSDYLSLHCPLNASTQHIINKEHLGLMKKSAVIINTGRGPLINEDDLRAALQNGTIAGAALDVLSAEPPGTNPLIGLDNCLITPHQAWAAREARARLMDIVVNNLRSYIDGRPVNRVN